MKRHLGTRGIVHLQQLNRCKSANYLSDRIYALNPIKNQWLHERPDIASQHFNTKFVRRGLSSVHQSVDTNTTLEKPALPTNIQTKTKHLLNQNQIEKVDTIFHKILWLDMFETSMLTELVNQRLGRVKLSPKQRKLIERQMDARAVAREMGGDNIVSTDESASEVDAEPKQVLVDMKLIGFDEKSKIKVIKEVRSIVDGLGLKEAKELVEGVPKTIHKGLKPELAKEYKEKLEAVGAQVEIVST
jgi:ribosomal protein L7/L12